MNFFETVYINFKRTTDFKAYYMLYVMYMLKKNSDLKKRDGRKISELPHVTFLGFIFSVTLEYISNIIIKSKFNRRFINVQNPCLNYSGIMTINLLCYVVLLFHYHCLMH